MHNTGSVQPGAGAGVEDATPGSPRLWVECLALKAVPQGPHAQGVCLAALPSIDEPELCWAAPGASVDPPVPQVDTWPRYGQ